MRMPAEPTDAAWPQRFAPHACHGRTYDLRDVDLIAADPVPDAEPAGEGAWLRSLARDAVVYGLPAALQYANLHRTVVGPGADREFNTWHHDRDLARPGYGEFRTPNVDTLYSTAWLDLTPGPVELVVPPMGDRYYTVNLLDAHSNAVNLSSRTLGPEGGRVWLVAGDWNGTAPDGIRVLCVATPYVWALMRIFVRSVDDVPVVRGLQDRVELRSVVPAPDPGADRPWPSVPEDDALLDGPAVLVALDEVLRRNGHPVQEAAHLARLRALGVGGPQPLQPDSWSAEARTAVDAGYADAMDLIRSVLATRGRPAGTSGWRTLSSGAYGYNYLHRAATNHVGLGGTTREESGPYTALVDAQGSQLDGRRGSYRLRFRPPPVDAFWSLTVYDLESRGLVPSTLDRCAVNTLTEGLAWESDGSLLIHIAAERGPEGATWLPAPAAPFYLVLRAYLGRPEVVDGTWVPCPVELIG